MVSILNILIHSAICIFNFSLELKYKIKRFFFNINHKQEVIIDEIYFINSDTNETKNIDDSQIKHLNDILKFSTIISLSNLKEDNYHLLEVKYKKHNKRYIINFPLSDKPLFFPIYTINELKHKNMNTITYADNEILIELLNAYGGPLNDFYISKDLGIPLKNIFDKENGYFPFRNRNYYLEDVFLNEYNIGEEKEIKPNDILKLKKTLDDSKINNDTNNEQYILSKYKKMTFDGKQFFWDIINILFRKQKSA